MKRLLLIFLLLPLGLMAQTTTTSPPEIIFSKVEQMPDFPGGQTKMAEFVKENLKYTPEAKAKKISGLVVVQFVVEKDGSVSNPEILKKLGYGLDEEVVRLVNSFPKFIPAQQNGKPVAFRFTLPVRF